MMSLALDSNAPADKLSRSLIGGAHVDGGGEYLRISDPATDEPVGWVPWGGAAEAKAAVDAASAAYEGWRAATPDFRADLLRKLSRAMHEHTDALARTLTREQGKPLAGREARSRTQPRSSTGRPRRRAASRASTCRPSRATVASS
jgi:acyl-CoA reductase-like NAD-dependent aldehyde dehydrogenase